MSRFVQIPDDLLFRLHELTKTEIIVLQYLYYCRNRKSGRCDPSRGTIAKDVNIDRAHVYSACASLETKGWLKLEADGNFKLFIPYQLGKPTLPFTPKRGAKNTPKKTLESVAESATNPEDELSRNPLQVVAKSATLFENESVAQSATPVGGIRYKVSRNAPQISKTHNIVLSEQMNNRGNEHMLFVETETNEKKITSKIDEDKKDEISTSKKSPSKGTRLPDPFRLTSDMRKWAAEKRADVDVIFETEVFVDFWRSKSGAGGTKLDWLATWRNWMRRAKPSKNGQYETNGRSGYTSERDKSAQRGRSQRERLDAIISSNKADGGILG